MTLVGAERRSAAILNGRYAVRSFSAAKALYLFASWVRVRGGNY
jgi:hypothetical protein